MNRRWNVSRTNPEFISYLSKAASISPVFAQVLISRGLKEIESVNSFLNLSLDLLHDPFLLTDMEQAVVRIIAARDNNESVLVHGVYDADGITATTVIIYFF